MKCPQCKNPFTAIDPNAVPPPAPTWEPVTAKPDLDFTSQTEEPPKEEFDYEDDIPAQPAGPRKSGGSAFVDYLLFRRMVTPVVMTVIFYLMALAMFIGGVVYGIISLLWMFRSDVLTGLLGVVSAFLGTVFGILFWRMACEIILALFRILDNVRQINERLEQGVKTQENKSDESV